MPIFDRNGQFWEGLKSCYLKNLQNQDDSQTQVDSLLKIDSCIRISRTL